MRLPSGELAHGVFQRQVATLTHTALKLIRIDPAILKRETLPMCQAHPGSAQRSVIIRMDVHQPVLAGAAQGAAPGPEAFKRRRRQNW